MERDSDGSLDLSHLTEDEQTSILKVLQRDLELRHLDEGRLRSLKEKGTDPVHLRTLSGAWFNNERSKRHYSWTSGCDLVHASLRLRKPKNKVTDVPLTGLFNGEAEKAMSSPQNNNSPPDNSLDKITEENITGSEDILKPIPPPRTKSFPEEKVEQESTKLCKEPERISNGSHAEEAESDVNGHEEDSDSLGSSLNDLDPSSLKNSSSAGSLHSSYTYKLRVGELRSRTLNLSVWHAESLGRNVFLGEVELALGGWDWTCTQPLWQNLQPRVHLSPDALSSRGTIMLSAKFVPEKSEGGGLPLTGELHIWLREAQGLLSNKGGPLNSFVRCYILPDASRQSGQKTRIVKQSISPTFNHTMVYDGFHTSDLKEACAELTVWQREGLKTLILGGIRLSCGTGQSYGDPVSWMDSTEQEITLWNSIIDNPNHWIDATLPIRTDLQKRP
ncbi:hypothetical protein WMY93_020005 [Mugilogobius chulae]|uniref:Synaptotagmin-like protein 1 n=1 Tax=Mugilogobius chulae TaxID=88201 RepID=A0AAW0NKR9_9GOBI